MDFTIYVLGDVRLFADTMNGIAMMFTVAEGGRMDLWASNTNGMGLGMGAFLGMLLAIISLVYNAAFRQRFDIRTVLIPLILYIVLTVPKVTVNIVDAYYAAGAQTVDNVPIGLALPMSAISSIAFTATEKLETIFSPPFPTATKITEDGFVMPLKLLHSMRYTSLAVEEAHPNVVKTVSEIVKTCLTNNEGFDTMRYKNSTDGKQVFFDALNHTSVTNRLVRIYSHDQPTGSLVTCDVAGTRLRITIEGYINSTYAAGQAGGLVSAQELKKNNLSTSVEKILASNYAGTGGRNVTEISPRRMVADLQALTNATNDEALAFMYQTVFNPLLSTATECASGTDNRAMSRCLSYSSATEQWKEKSAAEASGFLSIMRDGQNLLILLSVTLFPIMVLIVVLQGLGGLKVVMSYMLYTISAYMWIPVAAMINWYVQLQMYDELMKWQARLPSDASSSAMLSLANAPLFYDAVSKKLALANSVMASVPMICMGLFSGMLMTMNRLADKMNPASNFDASVNTPAATKREPFSAMKSQSSTDGFTGIATNNSLPNSPTMQFAVESARAAQKAQTHLKSAGIQIGNAVSSLTSHGLDTAKASSIVDQATHSRDYSQYSAAEHQKMKSTMQQDVSSWGVASAINSGHQYSQAEKKALQEQMGITFNANGTLNFEKGAGGGAGMQGVSAATAAQMFESSFANNLSKGKVVNQGNGQTGANTLSESGTDTNGRRSSESWQKSTIAALSKVATEKDSHLESNLNSNQAMTNLQLANSEMDSYSKAAKSSIGVNLDAKDLAQINSHNNGNLYKGLNEAVNRLESQGQSITGGSYISNATNIGDNAQAKQLSQLFELQQKAPEEFVKVMSGALGNDTGSYLPTVNGDGLSGANATGAAAEAEQRAAHAKSETDAVNIKTPEQIQSQFNNISGTSAATRQDIGNKSTQGVGSALGEVQNDYKAGVQGRGNTEMKAANKEVFDNITEGAPVNSKTGERGHVQVEANPNAGLVERAGGNALAATAQASADTQTQNMTWGARLGSAVSNLAGDGDGVVNSALRATGQAITVGSVAVTGAAVAANNEVQDNRSVSITKTNPETLQQDKTFTTQGEARDAGWNVQAPNQSARNPTAKDGGEGLSNFVDRKNGN